MAQHALTWGECYQLSNYVNYLVYSLSGFYPFLILSYLENKLGQRPKRLVYMKLLYMIPFQRKTHSSEN